MVLLLLVSRASAGGSAWVDAGDAQVDQKSTLTLHYQVGPEGLLPGDAVVVRDPEFHGVRWSQWGVPVLEAGRCTPQSADGAPSAGLVAAQTTADATVMVTRTVADDGGIPQEEAWTRVELVSGALAEGDELEVVFGDTAGGPDCGLELPERAFHHVELETWEELDGVEGALEPAPSFDIPAEPTVATLYVQVPSQAVVGEAYTVRVVPMDRFGNPVESWAGTVTLGGDRHTFTPDDHGVTTFSRTPEAEGVVREDVTGPDGLVGRSNPTRVTGEAPTTSIFWGDIHTHMGHDYDDDAGTNHDENVEYARDVVGLDVATESMKADPVCLHSETLWSHLQDNCRLDTEDGRFVSLLGFEWMGGLVAHQTGHHNFYTDVCTLDRPQHYDATDRPDGIDCFGSGRGPYAYAERVAATGARLVVVPHAPEYTGYNWDDAAHDDRWRRAVEVYSEWGIDMEPGSDASVPQGLAQGNHMGFIAASDNHEGWMGNPFSRGNTTSGLAAFVAPALTRTDVFDALQGRSTYATTGARIRVDAHVDDGPELPIGSWYVAARPTVVWSVDGTDTVASVTVKTMAIDGHAAVRDTCVATPDALDADGRCAIAWDGETETAVWLEVIQEDGEEAWTSPWWLSHDCDSDLVSDPAGRCVDRGTLEDPGWPEPDASTKDTGGETKCLTGERSGGCGCATAAPGGWAAVGLAVAGVLRRRRSGA